MGQNVTLIRKPATAAFPLRELAAKIRIVLHRGLQNEPRFGLYHIVQPEAFYAPYVGSICPVRYTIKRAASRQPADLANARKTSG